MENSSSQGKSSLLDFERPRLDDPLYKINPHPHGFGMNPSDGLPGPVVSSTFEDSVAADLSPDRFVCMGKVGRPKCQHYRRQLLPSSTKEHVVCVRFCATIRDEQGEMTDLRDQEVLACEFRDPPDPESAALFDSYDAEIIRRQEERKKEEKPFDPVKALEEQNGQK